MSLAGRVTREALPETPNRELQEEDRIRDAPLRDLYTGGESVIDRGKHEVSESVNPLAHID